MRTLILLLPVFLIGVYAGTRLTEGREGKTAIGSPINLSTLPGMEKIEAFAQTLRHRGKIPGLEEEVLEQDVATPLAGVGGLEMGSLQPGSLRGDRALPTHPHLGHLGLADLDLEELGVELPDIDPENLSFQDLPKLVEAIDLEGIRTLIQTLTEES